VRLSASPAADAIALIDVPSLHTDGEVVAAFEVEHTTSSTPGSCGCSTSP